MVKEPLEGIMVLTYTPFNDDFTLNKDAARQEIDWVIWPVSFGRFVGELRARKQKMRLR